MPYYAVHKGRNPAVYNTWDKCQEQINKYSNAVFKKFDSIEDATYFVIYGKTRNEYKYIDDITSVPRIHVFTDGSCINNGTKNAKAGIGIYFGKDDSRNISDPYKDKPTNNRAELYAIIKAYNILKDDIEIKKNDVVIYTDSEYSKNCFTTYGEKMANLDWKKDFPNKDLVQTGYDLLNKPNIFIEHVKAHTTNMDELSIGNRCADHLANLGANKS